MLDDYREKGFVFAPGLVPVPDVAVINDALGAILAREDDPNRIIREADGTTPRTIVNPHMWDPVCAALTRHPRLLGTVETLLGEQVYAWQMGINAKAAFNGDIWFWHQDYPAYHVDDHIPEARMVNALIFLDEVTNLNGPLMLVPGSHRRVEQAPDNADHGTSYAFRYATRDAIEAEVARAGIEVPTGPAGSVIFMNVNVLHGSGSNLSPWSRNMITLTYNAMSNKATEPSIRPAHIVPDDRNVPALTALGDDCLRAGVQ